MIIAGVLISSHAASSSWRAILALCRMGVAAKGGDCQSAGLQRRQPSMQLTPLIAVHMTAAITAVALGPVALWARKGATQRPKLHRAFGYAWVTMMLVAAVSAIFIRDFRLPNIAGYTPIHLLVPVTLYSLVRSFQRLARGDIAGHRKTMQTLYVSACLVAGAFTLLPQRYLGNLIFNQWLS